MSWTVETIYSDDLDGSEGGDIKTIPFAIDGIRYEIDLNPLHRAEFEAAFQRYIEAAHLVNQSSGQRVEKKKKKVLNRPAATTPPAPPAAEPVAPALPEVPMAPAFSSNGHSHAAIPSRIVPPPRRPATIDPTQARVIRKWAVENGHDIRPNGRIPDRILAAWENAKAPKVHK